MTVLIIWSLLLGATLGRFFKVLILVPASLTLLVAVVVKSFYLGHGLLHLAFEYAVLSASLQLGYVGALLLAAFGESGYGSAQPLPVRTRATFSACRADCSRRRSLTPERDITQT
jgi:hypothetical protein